VTTVLWPGRPYPLGATYDGSGTNFSVFSESATRVELCLFQRDGQEVRLDLPECTAYRWHGYAPNVRPGQRYGYRVHGPWSPSRGQLANPAKLLIDPYAKAIEGDVRWHPAVYGRDARGTRNDEDSAPYVPRSVVTSPYFDWEHDHPPRTPLNETVIYELHVKGFTVLNPAIPPHLRGTYAGLAHPAAIDHLRRLGVTAVELMPVHQFVHDGRLVDRGLRNYWGYNSIGYLAPHGGYASTGTGGQQVQEFKQMVKALHAAGIEVILDVVYNHTGEGDHRGPHLSLRGLDNVAYYRLQPGNAERYLDYTGTGNTLNMRHPTVLQLIMDSLRYWIAEMHVDGFRFDLAATLARELHDVDRLSAFFDLIQQDPLVSQTKLIAEPWDLGEGGYQVGNFPPLWSEWNGKYRDTAREFWLGGDQRLGDFASRLTGSSDLYGSTGRRPHASINFVTAHDGFTLRDLVSYNRKHNLDNGEDNRDGEDHNRSWNHGVEGPTADPDIQRLRQQQVRNLLATLLLSQGVPMLLAGDEIGRSQGGNNNAYCQDNPVSWIDWAQGDATLLEFVERLVKLRLSHPVFRRRGWFRGRPADDAPDAVGDINWFRPDGRVMAEDDWRAGPGNVLGVFLNGDAIAGVDARGGPVVDDSFFVAFNALAAPQSFRLPPPAWGQRWRRVLDTTRSLPEAAPATISASARVTVPARSVQLFRRER
jgi:glycogen operon protein